MSTEIENITFDFLIPHTKLIALWIIHRPLNQSTQSKCFNGFGTNLPKLNANYLEIYSLGDFNINSFENGKFVFDKSSNNNKNLDSFTKKYHNTALFSVWNNWLNLL